MAIESITLRSGDGDDERSTGPMTPGQFHKRTDDLLSLVRKRSGKVAEGEDFIVPDDEDFETYDWYPGEDIEGVALKLIEKHPTIFNAASRSQIGYFWKRKGGSKGSKFVFGTCAKAGGLLKAYQPELEFVIWLGADNVRDAMLTPYQIEAVLFHELKHVGRDAKAKPKIVVHDATVFVDEVTEYGLWMRDIQVLGSAFRQLTLEEA